MGKHGESSTKTSTSFMSTVIDRDLREQFYGQIGLKTELEECGGGAGGGGVCVCVWGGGGGESKS